MKIVVYMMHLLICLTVFAIESIMPKQLSTRLFHCVNTAQAIKYNNISLRQYCPSN